MYKIPWRKRTVVPVPGVIKRLNLRGALGAARAFKQHVIAGVGIERRVQIDQVNALIADAVAQNLQVVAVIQMIGHARPDACPHPGTVGLSQP
jgi:hypothetical protein